MQDRMKRDWDDMYFPVTDIVMDAFRKSHINWRIGLAGSFGDLQNRHTSEFIERHPDAVKILGTLGLIAGSIALSPDYSVWQHIALSLGTAVGSPLSLYATTKLAKLIGVDPNLNRTRHAVEGGKEFFLEFAAVDALRRGEVGELGNWLLSTIPASPKRDGYSHSSEFDFFPERRLAFIRMLSSKEAMVGVCAKYLYDNQHVQLAIAELKRLDADSSVVKYFEGIEADARKTNKDTKYIKDSDYKVVQADLQAMHIPQLLYRLAFTPHNGSVLFNSIGAGAATIDKKNQRKSELAALKYPTHALLNAVISHDSFDNIYPEFYQNIFADVLNAFEQESMDVGGVGRLSPEERANHANRAFSELSYVVKRRLQAVKDKHGGIDRKTSDWYYKQMQVVKENIVKSDTWKKYKRPPFGVQKLLENLHKLEVEYNLTYRAEQNPFGFRPAQALRYGIYDRLVTNLGSQAGMPNSIEELSQAMGYVRGGMDKRTRRSLEGKMVDSSERADLLRVIDTFIEHTAYMNDGYFQNLSVEQINARMMRIANSLAAMPTVEKAVPSEDYELIRRANAVDLAHYFILHFGDYLGDVISYNTANGGSTISTRKGMLERIARNWSKINATLLKDITTNRMDVDID